MNHTSNKYLIIVLNIVLLTILISSCNSSLDLGADDFKSSLKFNVNNAKAIAGFTGNTSRALNANHAPISRAFSSAELMKIKDDGTLESAITFLENNSNWTPDISFISIGSDKSVYICFSTPFQEWTSDNNGKTTMTAIQFVRIYPNNSYDVLWPLNPSNYNQSTDGVVNTWSWFGMDGDPVKKGDDGQIYLKVSTNSGNLSNDAIYSYDPTESGKPILRTPANASLSIASFKVDKQKHLVIKSHSPIIDSPSYMRYYTPNVITPINVYYSSNGNVNVRGYNTSPSGDAIILNGDHMNNMSGIIRANLQTNGSPTYDLLYPAMQYYGLGNTSYNMSYISTMFFDNDNNLYGLYDPNSLGFEPLVSTAILKLLDSEGNNSLEVVPITHVSEKISKMKIVDNYLYYRYSIMNGSMETGYHKLARFNLSTGIEEELITDSYLANRNIELQTYDISSDETTMYISALDYNTNAIIFGEVNLMTKGFTKINSSSKFNIIRSF